MPRLMLMLMAGCCLSLFTGPATAAADELTDARDALAKLGIRALSTGVAMVSEPELAKEMGKAANLKKALLQAGKDQAAAEQAVARADQATTNLRKQQIVLSAQLAKVGPNDAVLNNKLVGALQALEGQFALAEKEVARLQEQVKTARGKTNDAREAYIQFILDARKLANQIAADYVTKGAAPEVQAAMAKFNKAAGKEFKVEPSASFTANVRRLKALEDTVLSEAIPILGDADHPKVSAFIDGKYQQEMLVDSGASIVCLPWALALKYGLKPTDNDPKIRLVLADGREIEGWAKVMPSLRVGKFEVEKVECAVLGEDAIKAEPSLGMSFLRHFKFELDTNAKTLTMVKIAGADIPPPR
jgi:clan AA aspartic protease (TIGR02281 family)